MRHLLHAGVAAVALCAAGAHAQETTSSIRGSVTAADAPVAGAAVTVTHVPSGTVTTSTTGADGSFSASGLRVGGPYSVMVTAAGYTDSTVTDIQLTAGQPLRLPVVLESGGADIVVTATRSNTTEISTGPITSLGREAIEGVASVSRDIRDIARRDPFATIDLSNNRTIQIAGQNGRLNRFSVDGQRFSDNFGLNNGGLPTARGPVPLDAIEQFSVKLAPYDVTEGDFQGGAISLILRAGTNSFHGSAFYTYYDDKLTGDRTKPSATNPSGKVALNFYSRNYGAFVSGPIIKDKLFFALSYEKLKETTPVAFGTAGFANVVPNVTQALLDQVSATANTARYGNYTTLGLLNTFVEQDEKYTAKIDWNIIDGQRLSATYIHNFGTQGSDPGFATVSQTSPALSYASNLYYRPETVESGTAQLNSDWTDTFHTEIRGNYRSYDLLPTSLGAYSLGQIQVCTDPTNTIGGSPTVCSQGVTGAPGAARLYFGPDQFRQANIVRTRSFGSDVIARLELGNHSLKAEGGWVHQKVTNVFIQNAIPGYYFDSLADFTAGNAGQFFLGGSTTGNNNDIIAGFKYEQYNFGFQDSWDVNDRLNVTLGVRADMFAMKSRPPLNTAFLARNGFANTAVYSGKVVGEPRLGITWKPLDELTLRGGIGLFAGGSPDVFIGNSFSAAGVFGNSITINRTATGTGFSGVPATPEGTAIAQAALNNVTPGGAIPAAVLNYLRTNVGSIAASAVNAMDPGYEPQSTWKATFSADYRPDIAFLGGGWSAGGDFYFGFTQNAPAYRDLRLATIGTTPDGRPRYVSTSSTATTVAGVTTYALSSANTDLLLYNTKLGHSLVAVARFNKHFDWGLDVGSSYTFQDVKDQNPMIGTTASGSYGGTAVIDPNRAAYGTSVYQIRNSYKFNVDFDHAFFGDYKTRLSLFGERRTGLPYSLTMNDANAGGNLSHSPVFGTAGTTNRYLLYVPTGLNDPLVANTAADTATLTALDNYINSHDLGKYRGKILPKNTETSASFFKIDLHVDQEIPLPLVAGGRFKLFGDIENVLNLVNPNWGSLRQVGFYSNSYLATIVNVACVTVGTNTCAQYRYSNFQAPTAVNTSRASLYAIRVGAKVEF